MTYNLSNFKDPDSLTKCHHPKDNLTLANRLVISPNKIDTIRLIFCTKDSAEKIFLSRVWYCSKLDTKLIFLKMLDRKSLLYLLPKNILEV